MPKPQIGYVELRPDVFDKLMTDGVITVSKYLKLVGYPRSPVSGFIGYDRNKVGEKYHVFTKNGLYWSTQYVQYNMETFFRFVTPATSWNEFSQGGRYRQYVVGHYPTTSTGRQIEELVRFCPNGKMKGLVEEYFTSPFEINATNCHEYVFRAWREKYGKNNYHLDIYFHDTALPHFPKESMVGNTIQLEETGVRPDWLTHPPEVETKVFDDPRVMAVVEMLKRSVIPFELKRPQTDDYISWFIGLAGLDPKTASEAANCRGNVRLP